MLRAALGFATRCLVKSSIQPVLATHLSSGPVRQFSALSKPSFSSQQLTTPLTATLLKLTENPAFKSVLLQQNRSVTKRSIQSGKRKTVKAVIRSFYRLHWGIWIRTKATRAKRVYRKSHRRRRRLKNHVFTNATQSTMLDKMVTAFWKRPKYFVDSPYEPFHRRDEFEFSTKKPRPAHPPLE